MPADEGVAGGIDPDEAARLTTHLASLGVLDYFAYGQGNFSRSLENHDQMKNMTVEEAVKIYSQPKQRGRGRQPQGPSPSWARAR